MPSTTPPVVHFAKVVDETVHPLCGEWGDSKNWTKVRESVTCPRCLERLHKTG